MNAAENLPLASGGNPTSNGKIEHRETAEERQIERVPPAVKKNRGDVS
jgi:hypothetical protein